MKKDIHPDYQVATVKCVCGNEFQTRSTLKEISVEICSACHPFFTGQQKLIDSAGRVDRFLKKYGKDYASKMEAKAEKPAPEVKAQEKAEKPAPEAKAEAPSEEKPAAEAGSDEEPETDAGAGEDAAEATADDKK
ncbi:MAG: 50S ribosomal protein L31 [Candidatus Eisenbacteria bacterium]|nr:50S ribosomal protein L31 [Candidatus Eisenbacteria bacterium]